MKMMQGPAACLFEEMAKAAPTPTDTSTKLEPKIQKKASAGFSPGDGPASRVLPVPVADDSTFPWGCARRF